MTRKQWYFYSLMLPYLLPVLLMILAALSHRFLDGHSVMGWLSLFAMLQLTFGGFQYFMFSFFIYGWGKDKTDRQIFRASWALPLWFWPLCTLCLMIFASFMARTQMKMFFLLGLAAIPCGYFYVLLAHSLGFILSKTKVITD